MQLIFLDTTALHGGPLIRGTRWDTIRQAIDAKEIRVAVSEVTVQELVRQTSETVAKVAQARIAHDTTLESLGLFAPHSEPKFGKSEFEQAFRDRLDKSGIELLPLPDVSHQEILARDISVTPPFLRSGKGYRDTLIWLTLLRWHSPVGGEMLFVTDNSTDFNFNGKLAPALKNEVVAGSSVRVIPSLENLVEDELELLSARPAKMDVEDDSPEGPRIVDALLASDRKLIGTSVSFGDSTSLFGLRMDSVDIGVELEDSTVESVEFDRASADFFQYESLNGTTELWSARIFATLTVLGYVHKSGLIALPAHVRILDGDWNRRYAEVSLSIECELVYDVRVEPTDESAHAELTDVEVVNYR